MLAAKENSFTSVESSQRFSLSLNNMFCSDVAQFR